MDAAKKRELMNAYKNRAVVGGVYCVRCSGNRRRWLRATADLKGARNRFEQSIALQGAPEPSMRRELTDYGVASFSFAVLEELTKGATQTDDEFDEDLQTLLAIWNEKAESGELD